MKLICTSIEEANSSEEIQRVLSDSTAIEAAAYLCDSPSKNGIALDNRETYDVMAATERWSRDEIIEAMIPATGWTEQQLRSVC